MFLEDDATLPVDGDDTDTVMPADDMAAPMVPPVSGVEETHEEKEEEPAA